MTAFFPLAAVVAIGTGLWLSFLVGPETFSGSRGVVFNVGAATGLLAVVPGVMSGVQARKMRIAARAFEAKPGKPDPTLASAMAARGRRLSVLTKVAGGLMAIAVFGMATFRHFPAE